MKKKGSRKAATRKSVKKSSAQDARRTTLPNLDLAEGTDGLRQAVTILGDQAESTPRRSAALQILQAASFGITDFEAMRSDYVAALRDLTRDPDLALRRRAFGLLARSGDPYAEKALVDGLKDGKKALVAPSEALSFLSYNPHSGVQALARSVFETSTDKDTRVQALRVMAGDPQSEKTIQKTLADKNESSDVRQMSARALHALDPEALQSWARKAVLDKSEDDDVVATGMTALGNFGDAQAIGGDAALKKRIGEMRSKGHPKVKQMAKQIADKYSL